jgi:Protein of unknown function (DUF3618)
MSDVTPTSDPSPAPPAAPSVAELQAEIASAREDLVASLNALRAQTSPGALARRGGRNVAGFFTDEFGGIRPERVAIVGAVVIGFIAIRLLRRSRR